MFEFLLALSLGSSSFYTFINVYIQSPAFASVIKCNFSICDDVTCQYYCYESTSICLGVQWSAEGVASVPTAVYDNMKKGGSYVYRMIFPVTGKDK